MRHTIKNCILYIIILISWISFSQEIHPLISENDYEYQKYWVDSIYNQMTLKEKVGQLTKETVEDYQLSFFQLDDPVLEQIKEELTKIEIDTLTPVEALLKLNEIKKMVGGK